MNFPASGTPVSPISAIWSTSDCSFVAKSSDVTCTPPNHEQSAWSSLPCSPICVSREGLRRPSGPQKALNFSRTTSWLRSTIPTNFRVPRRRTGKPLWSLSSSMRTMFSALSTSCTVTTGEDIRSCACSCSIPTGGLNSRKGMHLISTCMSYSEMLKMSPTHLERDSVSMMGRRYWMLLVVSIRMTHSDTVIRVMPPSMQVAPMKAYVPGWTMWHKSCSPWECVPLIIGSPSLTQSL